MHRAVTILFVLCLAWSSPAGAQEPAGPQPAKPTPKALNLLQVSFASLEALDMYTSVRGIHAGAVEANPLMRASMASPVGLMTLKAGAAVSSIVLTRRMARRHPLAAVVLTAAVNSAYAAVVVHNVRVSRR